MQTGHCSSGNTGIGGVDVSSDMMDISGPVEEDVIEAVVVSGPLRGLLGSPDMFGAVDRKQGGRCGSVGWFVSIKNKYFLSNGQGVFFEEFKFSLVWQEFSEPG